MKTKNIEIFYKIIYRIFLIESILIVIGIDSELIIYGVDIQTPFMKIGILIGLALITIIRLLLKKLNTNFKRILGIILLFIMVFLCLYYVLEDGFRILI